MHLDMNAYEYMRRCVQIDVWWACVWFYAFVSTCEIACLHTHVYTRVNVCLYMWVCIHRPMYLGIFLIKVYFCQALQCTSLIPAGRSLWVWYQHGLHWKFQDIQSYIEKPCFKKLINKIYQSILNFEKVVCLQYFLPSFHYSSQKIQNKWRHHRLVTTKLWKSSYAKLFSSVLKKIIKLPLSHLNEIAKKTV